MDAFVEFVTSVDGSATWPNVLASFDRAFHRHATIVTSSGALDRRRWSETMCHLVECGASIHDFELNTSDSDHASFRVTSTPGYDRTMGQRDFFCKNQPVGDENACGDAATPPLQLDRN